jgi:hypothetical protein
LAAPARNARLWPNWTAIAGIPAVTTDDEEADMSDRAYAVFGWAVMLGMYGWLGWQLFLG